MIHYSTSLGVVCCLSVCMYLSLCLSVCLRLSLCLLSVCLSVCLRLSLCLLSVCLFVCVCCLSVSICLCLFVCMSVSICLSVCVYLSVCLSVSVAVVLCLSVSVTVSVCLFVSEADPLVFHACCVLCLLCGVWLSHTPCAGPCQVHVVVQGGLHVPLCLCVLSSSCVWLTSPTQPHHRHHPADAEGTSRSVRPGCIFIYRI